MGLSAALRSLAARAGWPRAPLSIRSYEGAGGTTRWPDAPAAWPNNAAALAAAGPLRVRARHAAANNPLIARGVETLTTSIVGTGIKPQSILEDARHKAAFGAAFERWTDTADADLLGDFYAFTESMVRAMIIDGEAVALMSTDPETGALVLRQIAAEQLDASVTRELPGGGRVVAGVEFDDIGRRTAYHILPDALDLPMATALTPVRFDAANVIHLFRRDFPGKVRGVSGLGPILLAARELDKAMDAHLTRIAVSALFVAFVTDAAGGSAGFDEVSTNKNLEGGLAPGTIKILDPGQSMQFAEPNGPGADTVTFMELQQRAIAAGLGVTAEQLTGDYSKTNYSASRASLIEFRRRIEAIQYNTVVFQFCRPVWRRWATLEILSGRLDAPGFAADPEPYLTARWVTPGWAWVDPAKEVAAHREAVEAGFASRREIVAGRGLDIEELDRERAADAARPGAPQAARPTPAPVEEIEEGDE